MTCYAIGDIHGHLQKLQAAHALIAEDRRIHGSAGAPVVHVGDLVDRGPDSRGVIQHLIDGRARGEAWVVLAGNHDRMFSGFLSDAAHRDTRLRSDYTWLHPALGGGETLASYGVGPVLGRPAAEVHAEAQERVPAAHRDFLAGLPLWHRAAGALFVHAGIRPGVAMEDQTEADLVWIRGEFLNDDTDHGALVVHGHTPVEAPTHYGNRLNIDSGAAFGGPLTAVAVEGPRAWLLTAAGRVELLPQRPRPGG